MFRSYNDELCLLSRYWFLSVSPCHQAPYGFQHLIATLREACRNIFIWPANMDGSKEIFTMLLYCLVSWDIINIPSLSFHPQLSSLLIIILRCYLCHFFFCLWNRKGKNNVLKSYNVRSYDYLEEKGDEIYRIDFPYVKHPVPTFWRCWGLM